ncbi:MAG: NUDIX hydrolase [Ardenticatenaceae bacterium]|nr:NUDIX hydrolase [Ardenticatenaceae bacterium]
METWVNKERKFAGQIFAVDVGEARLDDGTLAPREMVAHHGGVAAVPVLGDEVVLIRQYRVVVEQEILEIPAGRLEGNEPPEARAQAELMEEVGYQAKKMVLAHSYFSSAGFTDERMHIFLAFDLTATARNLEFDERIEVVRVPIAAIAGMLAAGEIEDAKTIIGLRALLAYWVSSPQKTGNG